MSSLSFRRHRILSEGHKHHSFQPHIYVLFFDVAFKFLSTNDVVGGPGSVVGITTGYRLDGPGIESRWGRDLPPLSRPVWGPPSPLYKGYCVFPVGKERPGRDTDPSPSSSAVVKKG